MIHTTAIGPLLAQGYMTGPNAMLINSIVIGLAILAAVMIGGNAMIVTVRRKETEYGHVLQNRLLLDVSGRVLMILTAIVMIGLGAFGYILTRGSVFGTILAGTFGIVIPFLLIRYLQIKRRHKLEDQLVGAVQMLASGVRAGLNLIQAMQMVARDGPAPVSQEFSHLVQEYEYGIPVDQAMTNASERMGSADYRLLFTALATHRERGGDLGDTLDRIGQSIREIQRLESKVRTETARGRATARWLGAMPAAIMGIYYIIDPEGVLRLFTEPTGNVILALVVLLNIVGFLWIRKIVSIDI